MISQNTISELNLKFKNDIMIIQNICDEFKKKCELSETLLKLNSNEYQHKYSEAEMLSNSIVKG
jgi:hypothetical protein